MSTSYVNKVISIAEAEVGYLEKNNNSNLYNKTENAGYGNYTKYAYEIDTKYPNFYNGKKNGYAYCDVFVDWCFIKAFGVEKAKELLCQPNNSLGAGCTYSARYYRNAGRFYTTPKVGDQIFFGDNGDEYHTGIVYKVDGSKVYTIEGNTSGDAGVVDNGGGVFKKSYYLNNRNITGYGRPKYDTSNSVSNEKPIVSSRNYLMKGDTGAEVKTMQETLIKIGYSCGSYGADGDFGNDTDKAVRTFQKDNGLVVDGKYGANSKAKANELLKKLSSPTSTKIDTVKDVQNWANKNYKSGLVVDGIYGANTKKALIKILQTELNKVYGTKLVVDGIWGVKTRAACPELSKGSNNSVVCALQALLVCNGYPNAYVDGDYGSGTYNSVKTYQSKNGLISDGIAGKNTFAKLCG